MENISLAWVIVMIGIQVVSRIVWRLVTYVAPLMKTSLTNTLQMLRRVKFPVTIQIIIHVNFD